MQKLAAQDRVFVILSEEYLQSPNCMFELFEIWRNARLDDEDFSRRIRVYRCKNVDIFSPLARAKKAAEWKKQFNELHSFVQEHGADVLGAADFIGYKRMQQFALQTGDILQAIADRLQPKDLEELMQTAFD